MIVYVVVTLFGAETPDSLLEPSRLQSSVQLLCQHAAWYAKPLRYSAYVAGPKAKNVGTGGKKFVPGKLLSELQGYMAAGYFHDLHCFEAEAVAQNRDPEFFWHIHKNWRYDRVLGFIPENRLGNGIAVTLAVAQRLLTTDEDVRVWINHTKQLFSLIQGTVGWVEVGSPWGRNAPNSRLQNYLIDYRYRDIPSSHYRIGAIDGTELDMRSHLALLEWGNLLGPHLLSKLGGAVNAHESLGREVHAEKVDDERLFVSASSEMRPLGVDEREALRRVLHQLIPA